MNKNGILLEVVQVLSDLDLAISKAYITSDGGWFMDGKAAYAMQLYHIYANSCMVRGHQLPVYSWCLLQPDAVFHVVDKQGQKVTDEKTIKHIEKVCNFFSTWKLVLKFTTWKLKTYFILYIKLSELFLVQLHPDSVWFESIGSLGEVFSYLFIMSVCVSVFEKHFKGFPLMNYKFRPQYYFSWGVWNG